MSTRAKLKAAAAFLALLLAGVPAAAQDGLEARRAESRRAYEDLVDRISLSEERISAIDKAIVAIRNDSAALSAALIQAAKTERKLSQDAADIAARLEILQGEEEALRVSLASRRDVLAEVIGALQRIGLNPPPAILVSPDDALSSVRSSILLAAVVPELRGETEILAGDLQELARVTGSIEAERERLLETVTQQAEEQKRLSLLLEEKQRLRSRSEAELAAERERAARLAEEAGSLRELIAALEADIEAARKRAEEAKAAALATPPPGPIAEPDLPGALPFPGLKGQMQLPVAGHVVRGFGADDGAGGTVMGDMVATHSGAIVTAPSDGTVLYGGPFRSYGQLLILDAGEGYHVVLAGMGRISVAPGQRVLAGEPVGVMGEARLASAAAAANENAGPELYIEFRKQGKPVDPAPWWTERKSGRTGNDS